MIHVKGDINEETFNEAYMMQTSTSPHYGIVASTEMAAAMMKGNLANVLFRNPWNVLWLFVRKSVPALKTVTLGF